MQKILKAIRMGNSVSIPLKTFGMEKGKSYLVMKNGEEIVISKVQEE